VTEFGATPWGADWTCVATHEMRFVQLLKVCEFTSSFALNDLGCGYGALVAFLGRRHGMCAIDYLGIDLSAPMVRHARRQCRGRDRTRFVTGHKSPRIADYSVASGIFNVQLNEPREVWEGFIEATLNRLAETSSQGFAVNFIEAPPRGSLIKPGLYTTEPERWATYCRRQFAAETQVIGGYGMREFSLLLRLPPLA